MVTTGSLLASAASRSLVLACLRCRSFTGHSGQLRSNGCRVFAQVVKTKGNSTQRAIATCAGQPGMARYQGRVRSTSRAQVEVQVVSQHGLCRSGGAHGCMFKSSRGGWLRAGRCPSTNASPNQSVNRTRYGRPAWPGRRYTVHFRQPGQAVLPQRAGYLQR